MLILQDIIRENQMRQNAVVINLFSGGYLMAMGWQKDSQDLSWSKDNQNIKLEKTTVTFGKDQFEVPVFNYYHHDKLRSSFEIREDAWFQEFISFVGRMETFYRNAE